MANDFNLDQFPLPKDWTRQELIDCTEDGNISYGIVQPGKHLDEGIPVLRVNNIGNNSLDLDAVMKVDSKIEEKYLRTRLLGGEVLLTLVGSTGQSIIAPEYMKGWNVARAIAVIRADENIGADWINICLQSRETHHYLNSRANTTVQKTLNLKDVRSIPIPIPPLKTKLFIENMATSLSKKIELNRQMNETLEAMAQALFKSWFVDFDPVIDNALAAGNAIPDEFIERAEQRKAIEKKENSEIQGLFPDEFEFTKEMGWIPKGWGVKKISDLVESVSITYPLKTVNEVIFLNTGDILAGKFLHKNYSDASSLPGQAKKSIKRDDILYSEIRPKNQRYAYVNFEADDYVVSTKLMVLRSVSSVKSLFSYFYLKQESVVLDLQYMAEDRSGTFPQITFDVLSQLTLTLPNETALVDYFTDQVLVPYHNKIYKNEESSENLAKLRDTLLPKLMSGELSIPDAAELVDEVL
jgi:type I restriction enzyme S subunit